MPAIGGWNYGMPEICLTSCPSILDATKAKVYQVLTEFLGTRVHCINPPACNSKSIA
jgi:hypothetical protein